MNLLKMKKWKKYYKNSNCRIGLRVRYEIEVDSEVKRAIGECINWLRTTYFFPKRLNLYVKSSETIKASNGENVCGTFFRPADRDIEPYIKVATGDYHELLYERGKDNALAAILQTIMHEICHYFQWLNDLDLTLIGEERQATNYSRKLMLEYAETRDHP